MRLRRKPWANALIEENIHNYVVKIDEFDLEKEFEDNKPIRLEIGMGKGGFIRQMALNNPGYNYLGIESNHSAFALCLKSMTNNEEVFNNLKIINADANDVLEKINDKQIDTLYLNFSDPWPKARHNRRRLTYPTMLKKYERILKKQALLIFKTDNESLFRDSLEYLKEEKWNLITVDYDYQGDKDDVQSEYEMKFRSENKKIYRLKAKKE